jgi:hypothetical protein
MPSEPGGGDPRDPPVGRKNGGIPIVGALSVGIPLLGWLLILLAVVGDIVGGEAHGFWVLAILLVWIPPVCGILGFAVGIVACAYGDTRRATLCGAIGMFLGLALFFFCFRWLT